MENTFLEKSYTKCGREIIPRAFSEKSKWSMSLDQQPQVLESLILSNAKLMDIKRY